MYEHLELQNGMNEHYEVKEPLYIDNRDAGRYNAGHSTTTHPAQLPFPVKL
jgi:hypothetical protein